MRNTAENSGSPLVPGASGASALPAPSGTPLPAPGGLPVPAPSGLPVPMLEPARAGVIEHPSIVGKLAVEEPEADEALVALAALPAEALAPPTFHDPIGLPEATRLSVLALFQDRASVWDRLDQLHPHVQEFERAVQRSFGPGQAPELEPLTPDGDPEAEVAALRDAITVDLERVRELNASISANKIELQRLQNAKSHVLLWLFVVLVLAGGGVAAYEFLL